MLYRVSPRFFKTSGLLTAKVSINCQLYSIQEDVILEIWFSILETLIRKHSQKQQPWILLDLQTHFPQEHPGRFLPSRFIRSLFVLTRQFHIVFCSFVVCMDFIGAQKFRNKTIGKDFSLCSISFLSDNSCEKSIKI